MSGKTKLIRNWSDWKDQSDSEPEEPQIELEDAPEEPYEDDSDDQEPPTFCEMVKSKAKAPKSSYRPRTSPINPELVARRAWTKAQKNIEAPEPEAPAEPVKPKKSRSSPQRKSPKSPRSRSKS